MKKDPKQFQGDITKEPYKGPSVVSAAAGEGYIAHFQWAGLGLLIGGALSALVPTSVNKIASSFEKFHVEYKFNENVLTRISALTVGAIRSGTDFITGHIPGKNWLATKMRPDRYKAVIFGGSLASAFGFFVVPWLLAGKGASKGLEGRRQFQRAKDEIVELRAENSDLREHNIELKTRITDVETTLAAQENRLRISSDETPAPRKNDAPVGGPEQVGSDVKETPAIAETPKTEERKADTPASEKTPAEAAAASHAERLAQTRSSEAAQHAAIA